MSNGQDHSERIRELTAQGLSEDEIVAAIMAERGSPDPGDDRWRERIRGLPGYERASEWATDTSARASQVSSWVADKGMALAGYARERLIDDTMGSIRGAPAVASQAATGAFSEAFGKWPSGAMRTIGEVPGFGPYGRAGEKWGEWTEEYRAAREPETGMQKVASGAGMMAPYALLPAAMYRQGGSLVAPALAEMAADWAGGAGSPEYTVAGMLAGIDPEAEGIKGEAREFGRGYAELFGGPEAIAESPIRAGASEAALFAPLTGLPLVRPAARAIGRAAEGGIGALKALDDAGIAGQGARITDRASAKSSGSSEILLPRDITQKGLTLADAPSTAGSATSSPLSPIVREYASLPSTRQSPTAEAFLASRSGSIMDPPSRNLPVRQFPINEKGQVQVNEVPLFSTPAGQRRAIQTEAYLERIGAIPDQPGDWKNVIPHEIPKEYRPRADVDRTLLEDAVGETTSGRYDFTDLVEPARRLYGLAEEVMPEFRNTVKQLARGGSVEIPDLKPTSSFWNKVYRKVQLGYDHDDAMNYVGDMMRASIVTDDFDAARRVIDEMRAKDMIVEFDDYWASAQTGLGYGAYHTQIRTPSGLIAELQVHLEPAWTARAHYGGHDIYDALESKGAMLAETPQDHSRAWQLLQYNQSVYAEAAESAMGSLSARRPTHSMSLENNGLWAVRRGRNHSGKIVESNIADPNVARQVVDEKSGLSDLGAVTLPEDTPGMLSGPLGRTAARGAAGAAIGGPAAGEEGGLEPWEGALLGAGVLAGGGELLARGLAREGPKALSRLQGVQEMRAARTGRVGLDELVLGDAGVAKAGEAPEAYGRLQGAQAGRAVDAEAGAPRGATREAQEDARERAVLQARRRAPSGGVFKRGVAEGARPVLGAHAEGTFTLHSAEAEAFHSIGVSTPSVSEIKDTQVFRTAIQDAADRHSAGAAVTVYSADEYADMRLFMTEDGTAGFALDGDDIVSMFKDPESQHKGWAVYALRLATEEGGKRLDAFDTILPKIYARAGFQPVGRTKFVDEFRPEGWKYDQFSEFNEGRPDVVAMRYQPESSGLYQPGSGRSFDDYDQMIEAAREPSRVTGFHGTKSEFDKFDLFGAGQSDPGVVGRAVYFSPTEAQARAFAESPQYGAKGGTPRVVSADMGFKDPLVIDDGILPDGRSLSDVHPGGITPESAARLQEEIVAAGHDGVIFRVGGEPTQYAVFNPEDARVLSAGGLSGDVGMVVLPGRGDGLPATGLRVPDEGLKQLPPSQEALASAQEVTLPGFNLDPSGTDRLNRHVARILDTSRDTDLGRATVTHAETAAFAREIGLDIRDLDRVAAARMTGAEMLATRDIIGQNITDLARHENVLRNSLSAEGMPLTPSEIDQTRRLINALESQNDQYLRKFIKARSEAGRNLNSLKILANSSLDPVTWHAKARRIKGSPLDEFQSLKLSQMLNDGNRVELAKYVGSLYDAPIAQKLVTLWKAGLLSNPATHLANITGNISMAVLETSKDAPAAFFDRLAAYTISDVRSKGGISADVVKAGWDAIDFRGAGRQVLTGQIDDAAMLAKYDIYKQVDFDNWVASGFLNAYAGPNSRIFASLQAGDKIFKSFALARSMMEQARLMAKQEGLVGDAMRLRADELINTDAALHARAINDAEVATFLNKGGHTTFKGIDLAASGEGLRRSLGTAGHVVAPFTRTPANIMDRVLEYSPVGFMADLPKMADWLQKVRQGKRAGGLSPDDLAEIMALQREMVEQAGRATIGTGVITMGYVLADMALLSGNYPTEAAERNIHQLLNEQPHSLKVEGHWLSLDRLSPVGNLLTLGAELHRMVNDPEIGGLGAMAAAPGVIGKTVVEQSFLRGVQGALTALAEPDRSMARWVRQTVASGVPSIIYATARATDVTLRDPQTVGEQVMSRLPGVSHMVTPSIDAFGGKRIRAPSLTGRIAGNYGPLTMRQSLEGDPVRAEVKRVGASIPPYRPRGVDRGTLEYEQLQREYGAEVKKVITRAIDSREYLNKESEARRLVRGRNPEYQGRDVAEVALELQAEYLQSASRNARAALTRERNRRR